MVVQIPAFDVPATGIVDYQDRSMPTQLTEGKWLQGDGLGQRHADRAPRARRLDPESRSERPRLLVERRARRLRPGRRAEPDAGRHRHLPAAGRLVRLPDALHADRQAGHRQDRGRLLLLQGRAEVHPAPGLDHRLLDRDPGRRGASPGDRVYRVPARRGSVRRAAALPLALLLDQAAHPLSGRHGEGAAEPAALLLLVAARVSLHRTCSKCRRARC